MSKPFKMRGPTFFKSAVKSYSPTKQRSMTPPPGWRAERTPPAAPAAPSASEMDWINPVENSPAEMKSPAKQNKWAGMNNPDHQPKPGAGDPGNPTLGTGSGDGQASATPKKSPAKQQPAKPSTQAGVNKAEAYARRGTGPLEKKSPAKKSPAKADPTWDEVKGKYDSYAAYKNMRKNAGLRANPNNPNA